MFSLGRAGGGEFCVGEREHKAGFSAVKCANYRAFRRAVMIIQRLYDNVIILAGVKISLAFAARMK
jgi:hypothetical protein